MDGNFIYCNIIKVTNSALSIIYLGHTVYVLKWNVSCSFNTKFRDDFRLTENINIKKM